MAKRRYYRDGVVRWYDDEGHRHREDGPASVWPNGGQFWHRHGDFHFAHGPAVLYDDGTLEWYEDNKWLRRRHLYG